MTRPLLADGRPLLLIPARLPVAMACLSVCSEVGKLRLFRGLSHELKETFAESLTWHRQPAHTLIKAATQHDFHDVMCVCMERTGHACVSKLQGLTPLLLGSGCSIVVRGRVSLMQRKTGVTAEQQPAAAGQLPPPEEEEEQGSDDEGWVVVQRLKAGQHFLPSEHSPSTGSGDWLIRVESAEVRAAARASCARPAWPARRRTSHIPPTTPTNHTACRAAVCLSDPPPACLSSVAACPG